METILFRRQYARYAQLDEIGHLTYTNEISIAKS